MYLLPTFPLCPHGEPHPGVGLLQGGDVSDRAGHLPVHVVDDQGVAQLLMGHRVLPLL